MVCVKGDAAEIAKGYFRLSKTTGPQISPQDLAQLSGFGESDFVVRAFDKWLRNLEAHNVNIFDLYGWEQDAGNCVAMIQAECDIVHESFSPLNCRAVLTTMLSVDEKHRRAPEFRMYREMIETLWSDTLAVPVNPPERPRLRDIVIGILLKARVDKVVPSRLREPAKKVLRRIQGTK